MYFEAVEEILTKLADPKIKATTKTNLQKQLKDLDPQVGESRYLCLVE